MFNILLALIFSPLLFGIINKTKAFFAGRKGVPLLQLYFDIFKLMQKHLVYSETTTWIYRFAPIVNVIIPIFIIAFLPGGIFSFNGDIVLVFYLFSLSRFLLVISAMDTGSSFEGMGAAREIFYAVFGELCIFMSIIVLAVMTNSFSLSDIFTNLDAATWADYTASKTIICAVLFTVLLLENCRIPFDDPCTHLELTMIHEVMVLDNSSFELALIEYASALKLYIWSALIAYVVVPSTGPLAIWPVVIFIAVLIGTVESSMARFKLQLIPQFLLGTFSLSLLAFFLLG